MFDQIEKLKQDYTDKYVQVVASAPELARFEGHVGQVKTINMNGRALVQFDAWNNIGWYDIELDYLQVVPKPEGTTAAKQQDKKAAAPRPAAKPAAATGEKKLSPLEMARMQGAAKGAAQNRRRLPREPRSRRPTSWPLRAGASNPPHLPSCARQEAPAAAPQGQRRPPKER